MAIPAQFLIATALHGEAFEETQSFDEWTREFRANSAIANVGEALSAVRDALAPDDDPFVLLDDPETDRAIVHVIFTAMMSTPRGRWAMGQALVEWLEHQELAPLSPMGPSTMYGRLYEKVPRLGELHNDLAQDADHARRALNTICEMIQETRKQRVAQAWSVKQQLADALKQNMLVFLRMGHDPECQAFLHVHRVTSDDRVLASAPDFDAPVDSSNGIVCERIGRRFLWPKGGDLCLRDRGTGEMFPFTLREVHELADLSYHVVVSYHRRKATV